MWLDDFDSIEWGEWGSDKGAEQPSEQQREKAAAALAGIKRTRKDEKKATRDNDFLREVLLAIITSGKYDSLLPLVLTLLEENVPSNLLVGGFSLAYTPASDLIRRHYTAHLTDEINMVHFEYTPLSETGHFDENTIDPMVRTRINAWIDDMSSVISYDPSTIMTERALHLLTSKSRADIIAFLSAILVFFFRAINILIPEAKARWYADFILGELKKKLEHLPLETI